MIQETFAEKTAAQLTHQADQMMGFVRLFQGQTEKLTNLWVDQGIEAMKENQKLLKEWWKVSNQLTADATKAFETNLKEFAHLFGTEPVTKGKA